MRGLLNQLREVYPIPNVVWGTATCGIAIYVLESNPVAKLKLTFYLRQNKLLTSLMLPNSYISCAFTVYL
jgi:hypothetical protein